MSTDADQAAEPSTASLITGILGDLQHLVEQQLLLTRCELQREARQYLSACGVVGLGAMILFLDAILLCLTLVHLLHWLVTSPEADPASIPLWECHAVVAAVVLLVGGILTYRGKVMLGSIEPVRNPVNELLQEDETWKNHPK